MEVATVEVNDEFRVELKQLRKRTDYSAEQAVELAEELLRAADRAQVLLGEHVAWERARLLQELAPLRTGEGII